jgi:hypothetical protein
MDETAGLLGSNPEVSLKTAMLASRWIAGKHRMIMQTIRHPQTMSDNYLRLDDK